MVSRRTLMAYLRNCRREGLTLNPGTLHDDTFYGVPEIVVVDGANNVVTTRRWDHSMEAIEEASEIAAKYDGWVTVVTPVVFVNDRREEQAIDDGFEVMVWPDFALRQHNDFVPITKAAN